MAGVGKVQRYGCGVGIWLNDDLMSVMDKAIAQARAAAARGEVPVGAVIVDGNGTVLAAAGNETVARGDMTAHAEMLALRDAAAQVASGRLDGCDIYVTLEPCPMCAQALSLARVRRLYFGAYDPKSGGVEHGPRVFDHGSAHHKPEVYGGIEERVCAELLREFFEARR